ncbi:MAG: hypothetical protein M3Y55_02005, partial [Pseudomonadota bacterium]|nr:hypothetical protein [Pseudomonadota bacterium]
MKTTDESWKVDAYVDGELDLATQLEIERRLQDDAALRDNVEGLMAMRERVREKADRHAAPAELRGRLTAWA